MAGRHKTPGDGPWWYTRSIENAGSSPFPNRSSLEGMVGVSSFAPVAAPEKPSAQQTSYEPESNPKPEYQPEPSGNRDVPPSEPPVRKGLSGWQKFGLGAGIAAVTLVGYFGINALRNQQIVPISTPTPAATATPAPTPTQTLIPTPTLSPTSVTLLKQYPAELADMIVKQPWFVDGLTSTEKYLILGYGSELAKPGVDYRLGKFLLEGKEKNMVVVYDNGLEEVAQKSVSFLQAKLPIAQEFIRVGVNWSLLFVHLQKVEKSRGAGGNSYGSIAIINAELSDYSGLEDLLGHEGGHLMLDQDVKGTILWYNETMAEIEKYFMLGGEEALDRQLALLDQTRSRRVMTKPLAEFNLDDHIGNPAKGIKATSEHVTRGLDLLLGVRRMVGHSAFEEAVIGITSIIQSRGLTDNDIREQLLLYTPEPLKADVASMYDAAVYGATK